MDQMVRREMNNYLKLIEDGLNNVAANLFEHPTGKSLEETYADLFGSDENAFSALLEIAGKKSFTQIYAIRALRGLRDPRAANSLIQLLINTDSKDSVVIESIIETLGEIGNPEAVPVINEYLAKSLKNSNLREIAIRALLKLPPSASSISALYKIIDEAGPLESIPKEAVMALLNIKESQAVTVLVKLIENNESFKNERNEDYYYKFIIEKMGTKELSLNSVWNRNSPNFGIAAIFDLKEEYAFAPILSMIDSPNDLIRMTGILALGNYPGKQVLAILSGFLQDRDLRIRTAAIRSLASIGDKESIGRLIEMLKEKNKESKDEVVLALNKMTGKTFFFGNTSYNKWHAWLEKNNT